MAMLNKQMVYQLAWDDLKEQTSSKFPKRLKLETMSLTITLW